MNWRTRFLYISREWKKGSTTFKAEKTIDLLTLSIQLSKSASVRSGGGLVTPESRVKVVGTNCNIPTVGQKQCVSKMLLKIKKKCFEIFS